MSKEKHSLRRLAESILCVITLLKWNAYIDKKCESEKRIFMCNVGLNLCLQIVTIVFLTIWIGLFDETQVEKKLCKNQCSILVEKSV